MEGSAKAAVSAYRAAALFVVLMLVTACASAPGSATSAPGGTPTAGPTAAASAVAVAATPSPRSTHLATPLPGCAPLCLTPNLRRPGVMHAGAYESRFFFGGQFTVQVPDGTWSSGEDSTGELELHQGDRSALLFWVDIWPVVSPANTRDPNFHNTAGELADWLAANKNVKVVHRAAGTLGGAPAEVVEFERSAAATNDDPGCPADLQPCVNMFGFEQWEDVFSSGGPFYNRLYTADVTWGGTHHVVSAMVWADTKAFFDEFAPGAQSIVEGATLPAGVAG